VAAGDLNGDGALDLVVGNRPSVLKNGENWVHLQDQAGNLVVGIAFGRDTEETLAVAVGDLNGDGALDVVAGNAPRPDFNEDGQNQVYFNDGTSKLSAGVAFDGEQRTTSLVLADFNGDGALDIVVGNGIEPGINNGGQNRIYYNDGLGNFPTSATIGAPGDTTTLAVGEEGSSKPGGDDFHATTLAVGEEGGSGDIGRVTTLAVGEEGGRGDQGSVSTMAVGEEGGSDIGRVTTMAVGEEGGTSDA